MCDLGITVYKFGVHSRHVIRCFHLHYAVFCLAKAKINTLPAYFYGTFVSEKSVFPNKACSACFDAVFDCITNMIGLLFYLSSRRQITKHGKDGVS